MWKSRKVNRTYPCASRYANGCLAARRKEGAVRDKGRRARAIDAMANLRNGKSLEPKEDNPEPVKYVKEGKIEVKEEEKV